MLEETVKMGVVDVAEGAENQPQRDQRLLARLRDSLKSLIALNDGRMVTVELMAPGLNESYRIGVDAFAAALGLEAASSSVAGEPPR